MSSIYGLRNLEWRYVDGSHNNWFNTEWGTAGFSFQHPIYPSYGHSKGGIFDREDPGELSSTYDLRYLESRNVDGTGNHSEDLGAAGTDFLRLTDPSYADEQGVADPAAVGDFVVDRGNARVISNEIVAIGPDEEPIPNSFGASDLFTYFGQFIDHDLDIAPEGSTETITAVVPPGDPVFNTGDILELHRSVYTDGTGVDDVPREHPNAITSFADASNIYGSSEELTQLLRADGGASAYLLTSDDDLPPTLGQLDGDPDLVAGPPVDEAFVGGDVRINENIALTSMHTVWIREHNYQVDRLRAEHPYWSEDALFDAAKIYVEAEYQNIVFNEYLPLLVGAENIPEYDGYDPTVNPSISHEFATAAFRLGHSQLQSTLHRSNEDGSETQGGNLGLLEAFFQPTELAEGGGVDALIRGLASYTGQEIDEKIVEDVRSFLFGDGGPGADLATLNILRGRDHGLGSLNDVREDLELARYNDFWELTSNPELAEKLAEVYGDIDNVDAWVGGLAEGSHPDDKVDGSQLGSTFQAIIVDQFVRLRDGDSYYFEERLENSPELLAEIKATSFSDIILRNTGIDYLQDDAFIAHTRIGGTNDHDKLKGTDGHDLIIGFKGKDHLYGKEGDDDLYGGKGNDKLRGQDGDDVLNGEEGDDVLKGGKGADLLIGGNGRDVLEGGWGSDVFVFDFDGKLDKVRDFEDGQDLIGLNGITYDDLYVREKFGGVLISYDGDRMYLSGLDSAQITEDDFLVT